MKFAPRCINIYLLMGALVLVSACKSPEERKHSRELSTIRIHLEVNADNTGRNTPVPIFRERPVFVNLDRAPFLDETYVERAWVEDSLGSHVIRIQFNPTGRALLEGVTGSNKGRRLAVGCQFPEPRWLGAPVITQHIADGVLTFTPDATREEAERIVRGLNNAAAKLKKASNI